jgi:hypothetical protein
MADRNEGSPNLLRASLDHQTDCSQLLGLNNLLLTFLNRALCILVMLQKVILVKQISQVIFKWPKFVCLVTFFVCIQVPALPNACVCFGFI